MLKAKVLAVDPVHVHICCPICGKLHRHGSGGNITKPNYGSRGAHCGTTDLPWTNGNFWDNPRGDSYELACTPETLRKEEDATGYVKRWYEKNRLTEFNKERRQRARDIKQMAKSEGIPLEKAYEILMRNKKPEIQIP